MKWIKRLIALPVIALWLALRIVRLPINFLLWMANDALEGLLISPPQRPSWPSFRSLWGWS